MNKLIENMTKIEESNAPEIVREANQIIEVVLECLRKEMRKTGVCMVCHKPHE